MAKQLSENESLIWFMILFPIFWPFIPLILFLMLCEKIKFAYWNWKYRRADKSK